MAFLQSTLHVVHCNHYSYANKTSVLRESNLKIFLTRLKRAFDAQGQPSLGVDVLKDAESESPRLLEEAASRGRHLISKERQTPKLINWAKAWNGEVVQLRS